MTLSPIDLKSIEKFIIQFQCRGISGPTLSDIELHLIFVNFKPLKVSRRVSEIQNDKSQIFFEVSIIRNDLIGQSFRQIRTHEVRHHLKARLNNREYFIAWSVDHK